MSEQPTFTGAIVLKARSAPEVAALAVQLAWYAEFGEPFSNRYEGGYAVKGQVRNTPALGAPDLAALEVQNREQAARIAELGKQVERLGWTIDDAERRARRAEGLLALLSEMEHLRLIGRNIIREHPEWWPKGDVIEPADDSPAAAALAEAILERAAQKIEAEGPDDVHVTLRAAERCAALVRAMKPTTETKGEDHA